MIFLRTIEIHSHEGAGSLTREPRARLEVHGPKALFVGLMVLVVILLFLFRKKGDGRRGWGEDD